MSNPSTQTRDVIGISSGAEMAMQDTLDFGTLQSDIQKIFRDEQELISRPSVLYSIAITVLATCTSAYYNGTTEVNKLALKAMYATVAQILGLNVGLAMGNPHIDNVAFAGIYYLMTNISGNLNRYNQKAGMEALAGGVAGWASNYYFSMNMRSGRKQVISEA